MRKISKDVGLEICHHLFSPSPFSVIFQDKWTDGGRDRPGVRRGGGAMDYDKKGKKDIAL